MASGRVPWLRHLTHCQARSLRASNQRRWAQVHDVRFLATTQPRRNLLEKYRDKLSQKAQEEGHEDIVALKEAYKGRIHDVRQQDAIPPEGRPPARRRPVPQEQQRSRAPGTPSGDAAPASSSASSTADSASGAQSAPVAAAAAATVKPLSAILDLAKARTLPVPELSAVWRLRHASNERALCAVVPAHTYAAMEAAARRHPHFILPVPHAEQGAEIHFLQWTFDPPTRTSTVLFTQLAEYKARGEFAQPHTTVTHHGDLAAEKGVVLMQGSVMEGRGVRVDDARWLVMCLQKFYGGWDADPPAQGSTGLSGSVAAKERAEERRRLLEWFGQGDARFTVERLLEEAERLG